MRRRGRRHWRRGGRRQKQRGSSERHIGDEQRANDTHRVRGGAGRGCGEGSSIAGQDRRRRAATGMDERWSAADEGTKALKVTVVIDPP